MTAAADRRKALEILAAAVAAGAWAHEVEAAARDGTGLGRRKGSPCLVSHRLSDEKRQPILLTSNQPVFAAMPPGQIVPLLADRGLSIGLERSFFLPDAPDQRSGSPSRAGPPTPGASPGAAAGGQRLKSGLELRHQDIVYLPTSVRGVRLYLDLVTDMWSRCSAP